MANQPRQKQAKVTVTTVTSNGGGKRRSRRRRTRSARAQTTTTRTTTVSATPGTTRARTRRNQRRRPRGRGPNTIHQTVTATLGTVGSNQGASVETEMVMLMNPSLTKETTGSNQFGPIQMYAATYAQWRITAVRLRATPIVGGSAVSGTVGRMSLNMTGNPTSASWSALGARPHVDLVPGKGGVLRLNHRNFPGPKEGWYNTNTKGDPNMSIGGAIEVHTLGKTMSTYKNEAFTGGLWLIELTATWEFRNYNPQPGLLNMVKGTDDAASPQATIQATAGQPIEMVVPAGARFARANAGSANNEVIWQVADTTVKAVTAAFPPPFNWLFQGGWWFIKRIAGAPVRAGEQRYRVYASIQDARADVPCIATATQTTNLTNANWSYQQITPGNAGISDDSAAVQADAGPPPVGSDYESAGRLTHTEYSGGDTNYLAIPPSGVHTVPKNANNEATHTYWTPAIGFGFKPVDDSERANALLSMDTYRAYFSYYADGKEVLPEMMTTNQVPFYHWSGSSIPDLIGYALAYSYIHAPQYDVVAVLWKCTETKFCSLAPNLTGAKEVRTWQVLRESTVSNAVNATYQTPVWGGMKLSAYNTTYNQGYGTTVRQEAYYVTTFASIKGQDKITIGNLTIKAQSNNPSDGTNGIPGNITWINPNQVTGGGWLFASLGSSIQWSPFTSTIVTNASSWPTRGVGPARYEPGVDEDTDYETDPEMLPDMTDTEDESPGSENDEGAPSRPPTPAPGPGEHWSNPPPLVLEKMTSSGKKLYDEMLEKGVPSVVCRRVAQETAPHPAYKAWSDAYHDALVDGCCPPTARSVAWDKATKALGSRGHAE